MSSRLDYLSKYLQHDDDAKKKKKKKKKATSDQNSSFSSTPAPVIVCNEIHPSKATDEDEEHKELLEVNSEDTPVTVESGSSQKQNMGFKRIDNGNVVERNSGSDQSKNQNFTAHPESVLVQPSTQGDTIYRDSGGRIVNLEDKRIEIKNRRDNAEENKRRTQEAINLGEVDKIRHEDLSKKLESSKRFDYSRTNEEYVNRMKQRDQFDDPLSAFASKEEAEVASVTGRPIYQKGVQPVNRFNISAGYFWDGIDRSNGFETKLVTKRNEIKMKNVIEKNSKESYTEYDFE